MSLVLNIFADPQKPSLSDKVINSFIAKCEGYQRHEVLETGKAARIFAKNIPEIKSDEFDIFITNEDQDVKLLVCDMESTIIKNEFLDEIGDYLGIGEEIEKITARAMNGELDFKQSLFARIDLIKNLSKHEAQSILKDRLKYNVGAKELVVGMKKKGVKTLLVSGGFTLFTEAVARELGFDEHHANEFIFENDKLVSVKEPILGKDAKLEIMTKKCAELGIKLSQAIAVGDGANDLPMLTNAGIGVAYYAKPKVKEVIKTQINHADLFAITHLA